MDRLGKIVRAARDKRGETLKQMARAIKCSEAFARHIEHSKCVPVSERLINALKKHYRLGSSQAFARAATARWALGSAYYSGYNKKR